MMFQLDCKQLPLFVELRITISINLIIKSNQSIALVSCIIFNIYGLLTKPRHIVLHSFNYKFINILLKTSS